MRRWVGQHAKILSWTSHASSPSHINTTKILQGNKTWFRPAPLTALAHLIKDPKCCFTFYRRIMVHHPLSNQHILIIWWDCHFLALITINYMRGKKTKVMKQLWGVQGSRLTTLIQSPDKLQMSWDHAPNAHHLRTCQKERRAYVSVKSVAICFVQFVLERLNNTPVEINVKDSLLLHLPELIGISDIRKPTGTLLEAKSAKKEFDAFDKIFQLGML